LRDALGLDALPRRIEGIDIANLMGKEVVGSLVSFLDGQPFKDGYRRYRIKTVDGQDDFASIAEVVRRRYGKMAAEGGDFPDIILIDGGKGQLNAAAQAMAEVGARPGVLMSLAEKEEIPYLLGCSEPLPLSQRNAGLKLLMYVRDEAHRFAQHYHHILRRKAMFGEK
jgi:excinuclease ABC subunit C